MRVAETSGNLQIHIVPGAIPWSSPGVPLGFAGMRLAARIGLLFGTLARIALSFTRLDIFVAALLIPRIKTDVGPSTVSR